MKKVSFLSLLLLNVLYHTAEAETFLNVSKEYENPAGYIYLRTQAQVFSNPSANISSANYYDWVQATANSYVNIKAISQNTDFMATGEICGSADRNTRAVPAIPTHNWNWRYDDYSAYAGRHQMRVAWVHFPWRRAQRELHLGQSAHKKVWVYDPFENPFDPYAYAYGDGEPSTVVGGSVNTD